MDKPFLILDFGSQFSQMIVRKLRELGVYSELIRYNSSIADIKNYNPSGIILSGGPNSVFQKEAPITDILQLREIAPLLGICYGMQLLAHFFGGKVVSDDCREYGLNQVSWKKPLFSGQLFDESSTKAKKIQKVWMSHGDVIKELPSGFELLATSGSGHPAVMQDFLQDQGNLPKKNRVIGVQFHPEVHHTQGGEEILRHFVFDICKAKKNWLPLEMVPRLIEKIRKQIPKDEKVLCALSGGVDSTVTAVLLTKALGKENVNCIFVDTGLLRKNEFEQVINMYKELDLSVAGVSAEQEFLEKLNGVSDPEQKRVIIGHTFIDVFKKKASELGGVKWLAQGTLYPDVIESVSSSGASVTIKSHHNVGGLPKNMGLKLVEPLREFYKDEVRKLGRALSIPESFLMRHPFPGPGLAIRIMGEITQEDISILQDCDAIYIEELRAQGLYDKIWQAFCVLLPVKTVGVQGDARSYEKVLALRAVTSKDAMTADWYSFSFEFLQKVSNRITNEVRGINRVVYDITSKPPGTIEWE